jgi:hypothetical protein
VDYSIVRYRLLVAPSGAPAVASPVEGSVVMLARAAASTTASAEWSPGRAAPASGASCGRPAPPPRDCVSSWESSRASADPVLPCCGQVNLGFLAIGFWVPFRHVRVPGFRIDDVIQ